ncbi:hypothetical protein QR685DRAFT_557019 [Neurospora intermedia]|uniref:Uncharacterized protein n=1 Tax=Neurospora intermedia TaxID=5142 RepID=A0ABR3D1L7_NEUIN
MTMIVRILRNQDKDEEARQVEDYPNIQVTANGKGFRDLLSEGTSTSADEQRNNDGASGSEEEWYNVSDDDDAASLNEWFEADHIYWSRGYKDDGAVLRLALRFTCHRQVFS